MNGAFEVGAVALRAQQRALDTIANNIANVNTPAYKRSDIRFSEVIANQAEPLSADAIATTDVSSLGGVRMSPREMLLDQGELKITGGKLDIAVDGAGYIELMGPSGQPLLWRGGTMKVNDNGLLAAENGLALRAGITIPDDASNVRIETDGMVRAEVGDGEAMELGQIMLVRFDNDAGVERLDGGLYRVGQDVRIVEARPGEDGVGFIIQGSVEGSNVELTAEMVELLMVQRAFGASAQIVQAADQLAGLVNNLKR